MDLPCFTMGLKGRGRDGLGYKDRPLSGPSLFPTQPETRPWLSFIYCNLMWAFWGQRKVSYSLGVFETLSVADRALKAGRDAPPLPRLLTSM